MGKRYIIQTQVNFYYESCINEFDNEAKADEFGYYYDNLEYDSVESVEVEEIETCDECENDLDSCDCEDEQDEEGK